MVSERYLPTYRQNELALIIDYARRGESLSLVGVAGVGKSNIVRILRSDNERKALYLAGDVAHVRFAAIDINRWQRTPVHLWQLMLEGVQAATADLPQPPSSTIVPMSEEERVGQRLQNHIDWICQTQQRQLMLILDDCDPLLGSGPLSAINNLNALRDAGNPGKLSYLLFTKRLPQVLGRAIELGSSKFYDLIKRNVFALGLYSLDDAQQMARFLNAQVRPPLRREELAQVVDLAGGHGGLLRTIFETWLKAPPSHQDFAGHFARQLDIQTECRRILRGLHPAEQQSALLLAKGMAAPEDAPLLEHLMRRGLLASSNPPRWFSPLMAEFLRAEPLAKEEI